VAIPHFFKILALTDRGFINVDIPMRTNVPQMSTAMYRRLVW
jgi:hypothetical protein